MLMIHTRALAKSRPYHYCSCGGMHSQSLQYSRHSRAADPVDVTGPAPAETTHDVGRPAATVAAVAFTQDRFTVRVTPSLTNEGSASLEPKPAPAMDMSRSVGSLHDHEGGEDALKGQDMLEATKPLGGAEDALALNSGRTATCGGITTGQNCSVTAAAVWSHICGHRDCDADIRCTYCDAKIRCTNTRTRTAYYYSPHCC